MFIFYTQARANSINAAQIYLGNLSIDSTDFLPNSIQFLGTMNIDPFPGNFSKFKMTRETRHQTDNMFIKSTKILPFTMT